MREQEAPRLSPDLPKPALPLSSKAPPDRDLRAKPTGTPSAVLDSITFRVRPTVENAVNLCSAQATAKGIELTCLLSYEVSAPMRGDPSHLRRILISMLEKIIARMEQGEIIIRNTLINQTPRQATFRFSVTVMSHALTHKGTAWPQSSEPDLGIAKHLVVLSNGDMGQETQPEIGTTYWFSLSFDKLPPKALSAPPPRSTLNGVRALIFGDLHTLFTDSFQKWGMPGHHSKDADETMRMLLATASYRSAYEVAILTCQQLTPAIVKLATSIRTTPALNTLRLILLVGKGKKGDVHQLSRIPIDVYLTMPMTPTEIFDCLATTLNTPARSLNPDAPLITRYSAAEAKAQTRSRMLLIDSAYEDQKNAVRVLEELGYSADVVTNAQEAFAAYSQTAYTAVLLAYPLPQREGFTITARIRQHDRRLDTHTPIIGLTTRYAEGNLESVRQLGMDDIIAKPVSSESLKKTLAHCTKAKAPAEASRPIPDTSAVCNIETALAQLDDDRELFNEMIALFLEEYPRSLAKIHHAIVENDLQALTYSANALRGALSHFYATGAMTLALQLEQCGRKGDLSQVSSLLAKLENLLPRVAAILVNAQMTIAA